MATPAKGSALNVAQQGNKRFYSELRRKEKAANQRMVRLERAGLKSPAYQAVQAKLEILGKQKAGDRGRRFSESGKATYNEMEMLNKILDDFLSKDVTSTVVGAKTYLDDVWTGANKGNRLAKAGITKEQWLDFWESMPKEKDRLYGSEQIVAIIRAYSMKYGSLGDEGAMSVEEIAEAINASNSLSDAYDKVGITYEEAADATISFEKD